MKKILPGNRYGQLVVLCCAAPLIGKNRRYKCQCDCGNVTLVWTSGLVNKIEPTQSCGCLQLTSTRRPPGQAAKGVLWARLRKNAEARGFEVDLSFEQHNAIIELDCFYCGGAPKPYNPYITKSGKPQRGRSAGSSDRAWVKVNGIDRVDSNKAYTIDNCVSCCSQCNYNKLDYTVDEFIDHAYAVVEYQERLKKEKVIV